VCVPFYIKDFGAPPRFELHFLGASWQEPKLSQLGVLIGCTLLNSASLTATRKKNPKILRVTPVGPETQPRNFTVGPPPESVLEGTDKAWLCWLHAETRLFPQDVIARPMRQIGVVSLGELRLERIMRLRCGRLRSGYIVFVVLWGLETDGVG